jgi:polysaccharide biosynthesis transport protein
VSSKPEQLSSQRKTAGPRKTPTAARFSPLSLARMVWKQKVWVLIVWVIVAAAGAFVTMRLPPRYRAETLILVEVQKIPDKYVSSTVVSDVQDRLATMSQEILSANRLKKIIEDYKLYPETRAEGSFEAVVELMRRDVSVKLEKGWTNNRPGAFRISYEGAQPTIVAAVANRLASAYIDENLRVREQQAEGTSQFLDGQLKEAKKTLDELEAAVSRYKVAHNGELPQQEGSINTTLMRLQTELQGIQDAMNRAQQNKVVIEAELGAIDSRLSAIATAEIAPREAGAPPGETAAESRRPAAITASQALELRLAELKARYSDDHPEVRRMKAALAQALKAEQEQPAAPPASPRPRVAAPSSQPKVSPELSREAVQLSQRASTLRAQRAIAADELEKGAADRVRVLKTMGIYQAQLKSLPIREQEMAALMRDYEMSKANYRSLLDKKTSADMAAELEHRQKAERFLPLDPAVPPERPFKPNRGVLIGASTVAGLALGISLALAREMRKNVLLGEWELPAGVVVLGRVPNIDVHPRGKSSPAVAKGKKGRAAAAVLSAVLPILAVLGSHLAAGVQ